MARVVTNIMSASPTFPALGIIKVNFASALAFEMLASPTFPALGIIKAGFASALAFEMLKSRVSKKEKRLGEAPP